MTAYDTGTGADVELATAHGNGRTFPAMGAVSVRAVTGSGDSLDVSLERRERRHRLQGGVQDGRRRVHRRHPAPTPRPPPSGSPG